MTNLSKIAGAVLMSAGLSTSAFAELVGYRKGTNSRSARRRWPGASSTLIATALHERRVVGVDLEAI